MSTNRKNNIRPTYSRSSSPSSYYREPTVVKSDIGLGTAIKTGFGMNIGNKLGDWLFGSSQHETKIVEVPKNYCSHHIRRLEECLKLENEDCKQIMETLKKCQNIQ